MHAEKGQARLALRAVPQPPGGHMTKDGAFLSVLIAADVTVVASRPEWPSAFTTRQFLPRDPLANPEPCPKEKP